MSNDLPKGFVKRLYDLGVVDRTVTDENVVAVLQRAADRGVLPVATVLDALTHEHQWSAPNDLATCVICDLPRKPTRRSTDRSAPPTGASRPDTRTDIRNHDEEGNHVP